MYLEKEQQFYSFEAVWDQLEKLIIKVLTPDEVFKKIQK